MEPRGLYKDILGLENETLVQELATVTQRKCFKEGELLFHTGEISNYIYFLEHGVVRGVLLDVDGKDITDCLVFRCGEAVMASFDRLELDIPSSYSVEVLEDSCFFCVPMEKIVELKQKYFDVAVLHNQLLIAALEEHRETKLALYQFSAVERYQWFLKKYPDLINRIHNKQIASFLGMTPVTLSRLRRNLRGK